MSSHHSEEESDDPRFKTITSAERTRNPTTDKKQQPHSVKFRRSQPLDFSPDAPRPARDKSLRRSQSLMDSL